MSCIDNTSRKLIEDILPELQAKFGLQRIGFESAHVTHASFAKLQEARALSSCRLQGWIEDLRMVKDADELARIRAAVLLNERVFLELVALAGPQITEADIAAEIEYRSRKLGAEATSFSPIIASGVNSSLPHAGFSSQKLVPGMPLTIDMGVQLNGYCSDMTRTVFFKDCPPKWERIYNIVREAKRLAQTLVKPGAACKDVDAAAREHISAAGYGEFFGHGLGHGVGIEVHEGPRLARTAENVLEAGNVCTNEPGIYLPDDGGIRIEDMFVVTADGSQNLNTLDDGIMVVG